MLRLRWPSAVLLLVWGCSSMEAPSEIPAQEPPETPIQLEFSLCPEPKNIPKIRSAAEAESFLSEFASFYLVTESTSNILFQIKENKRPVPMPVPVCEEERVKTLYMALVRYPWPKRTRGVAREAFLRFLLNQQVRMMPLHARLTALELHQAVLEKGYIYAPKSALSGVLQQGKRAVDADSINLELSEKLRSHAAKYLPLP